MTNQPKEERTPTEISIDHFPTPHNTPPSPEAVGTHYVEPEKCDDPSCTKMHWDTPEAVGEKESPHKFFLDALEMMYDQYCSNGHLFMSAGERASAVLSHYGFEFDRAGRITKRPNQ